MNDFDAKLRERLDSEIDAELGERRPAPPFVPVETRRGVGDRRAPWLLPLAAAAIVLAIAGGTVAASGVFAEKQRSVQPGSTDSHPPTDGASATRSSGPVTTTTGHMVQLGAAHLWLPDSWVARDYGRYLAAGTSIPAKQAWCLTPSATAVSTKAFACPLRFELVDGPSTTMDVDAIGGYRSDPPQCYRYTDENAAERPFGERDAEWRTWQITCGKNRIWFEQYVVPIAPAYVLTAQLQGRSSIAAAINSIDATVTFIASHSVLPPQQSGALRLMDRGYLRSAQRQSDGVHIVLDRLYDMATGPRYMDSLPDTYDYVIPTALFDQANAGVGAVVSLVTDGTRVREFQLQS